MKNKAFFKSTKKVNLKMLATDKMNADERHNQWCENASPIQ